MVLEEHYQDLYNLPDWQYRELPFMLFEYWQKLVDTIGENNLLIVSGTIMQENNKSFRRASVMISPEGMKNIKNAAP